MTPKLLLLLNAVARVKEEEGEEGPSKKWRLTLNAAVECFFFSGLMRVIQSR
jgi:hypothetical protein